MDFNTIYRAGTVTRYHTRDMIRQQNIAEHSWGVLAIILHINPSPSVRLVRAAVHHDLPEFITGDLPATLKWQYPELSEKLEMIENDTYRSLNIIIDITATEALLLKYADMAELLLHCMREYEMGNLLVSDMLEKGSNFLIKQADKIPIDVPWYDNAYEFHNELLSYKERLAKK